MAARLLSSIGGRVSGRRLSRSGTQYRTQSMCYQHCCRTNTNWKLFVSVFQRSFIYWHCNNGLAVTFVTLVTLILLWWSGWLLDT